MSREQDEIAKALWGVFMSPNELDRNMEAANVVDALYSIARGLYAVADAIRDRSQETTP